MIWLKGIIYKTEIPYAKVCVCVSLQYHTRKSLNFDLTHLKPKIKHKNLVSISKTETHTT